jgi:hypothetical protein
MPECHGLSPFDLQRALSMTDEGGLSAPSPDGDERCGDPA